MCCGGKDLGSWMGDVGGYKWGVGWWGEEGGGKSMGGMVGIRGGNRRRF